MEDIRLSSFYSYSKLIFLVNIKLKIRVEMQVEMQIEIEIFIYK